MNDLPGGWSNEPLGELSSKIVDGSHNPPAATARGLPMLSARNIEGGQIRFDSFRYIPNDAFKREHARTRVAPGDVLLTIVGTIGRSAVVPADCTMFTLQRSVAVVGPKQAVSSEFLRYYLESGEAQEWLLDRAKGTAQKGVYLGTLAQLPCPLPPLAEQRRIVAKLDALTARTARARADLDRVPALAARYKQAVLIEAFSGRLTTAWRAANLGNAIDRSGLEDARTVAWNRLPKRRGRYEPGMAPDWSPSFELPASWRWASVDEITYLVQYGTSAKTSDDAGVPVLRMGNIVAGALDYSSLKFLSPEHEEFPELLLDGGDLLFNRTNSAELVGKAAVFRNARQATSFASYLIRLKTVGYIPELLSAYINSPIGRAWVASATSQQVGQANVNGSKLRRLAVPLMTPDEQLRLWVLIRSAFAEIDRLSAEAAAARRLLDRLDQAILSKAFRGELVPQDPADEPASVLLERIRAERTGATAGARRGRKPKAA